MSNARGSCIYLFDVCRFRWGSHCLSSCGGSCSQLEADDERERKPGKYTPELPATVIAANKTSKGDNKSSALTAGVATKVSSVNVYRAGWLQYIFSFEAETFIWNELYNKNYFVIHTQNSSTSRTSRKNPPSCFRVIWILSWTECFRIFKYVPQSEVSQMAKKGIHVNVEGPNLETLTWACFRAEIENKLPQLLREGTRE